MLEVTQEAQQVKGPGRPLEPGQKPTGSGWWRCHIIGFIELVEELLLFILWEEAGLCSIDVLEGSG